MGAIESLPGQGAEMGRPAVPPGEVTLMKALLMIAGALLAVFVVGMVIGKFFFWETFDRTPRLEQQFNKALADVEAAPEDADKRVALGWTYFRQERYNEALAQYNKALEINGSHFRALYNLGLAYMSVEKYERAVSAFERAIAVNANDHLPHYQIGIALQNLGRLDEALKELQLAYKLSPGTVAVIYQLGLVHEQMGNIQEAAYQYQSALEFDPKFTLAGEGLERVLPALKTHE